MTRHRTIVGIDGDAFQIGGVPTYHGRCWRGRRIEGLLLNARMVQGIFDDLNPATRGRWDYPDGPWDPERNTRAFIAAMPGWKSDLGRRIDKIIERMVPNVYKAVKWNSPFYGFEAEGGKGDWFLGMHCMTKYIKVAFFFGAQLKPLPPGESKQKNVRYLDIHENDKFDEAQFTDWVKQASKGPLERL